MTDEHTPGPEDREPPASRAEEALSNLANFFPGPRDPGTTPYGDGITKRIVGFRRDGRTVDAVEALGRLFTAIGDLLELAEADRDHRHASAAQETAGDDERTEK
jgi:hypothetical protein